MYSPSSRPLAWAGAVLLLAIGTYLTVEHWPGHRPTPPATSPRQAEAVVRSTTPAVVAGKSTAANTPAVAPAPSPAPAVPPPSLPHLATTGRIAPDSLAEFTPLPYPGGTPHYEDEPVTAYIAVPSTGKRLALTVNQLGEFPRLDTQPSENVEVRMAFARTAPGAQVTVVAQDGGKLHLGKLSAALAVDAERQVAFGFTVSANIGLHRIAVTTPSGEVTTLEFWAGPPPILMQAATH